MALSHLSVVRNSGSDPLKPDLPFLGIPLECLDVGELDLMGLWWAGQTGFSEDNLLVNGSGHEFHCSGRCSDRGTERI